MKDLLGTVFYVGPDSELCHEGQRDVQVSLDCGVWSSVNDLQSKVTELWGSRQAG
jgi:hypothetical protein